MHPPHIDPTNFRLPKLGRSKQPASRTQDRSMRSIKDRKPLSCRRAAGTTAFEGSRDSAQSSPSGAPGPPPRRPSQNGPSHMRKVSVLSGCAASQMRPRLGRAVQVFICCISIKSFHAQVQYAKAGAPRQRLQQAPQVVSDQWRNGRERSTSSRAGRQATRLAQAEASP